MGQERFAFEQAIVEQILIDRFACGGWISKTCTDIAGSSRWFERGFVTYSNAAKTQLLGVPAELIATHGAVSEPVVRAMAHGAALHAQVPIAVASTGIAGPDGGSPDKPVGTVWLGWWVDGVVRSQCFHFDGPRSSVRAQAVYQALLHLEKIIAAQGAKADPGPRP